MTRKRLRNPEAARDRAAAMYRAKLAGRAAAEVGAIFGLTSRHVNREIASLPEASLPEEIRRRIRATEAREVRRHE